MSEARTGGPDMLLGISDTTAVDMPRCGVPGMPRPIGLNGDCVAEGNLTGVPGCGGVAICNPPMLGRGCVSVRCVVP